MSKSKATTVKWMNGRTEQTVFHYKGTFAAKHMLRQADHFEPGDLNAPQVDQIDFHVHGGETMAPEAWTVPKLPLVEHIDIGDLSDVECEQLLEMVGQAAELGKETEALRGEIERRRQTSLRVTAPPKQRAKPPLKGLVKLADFTGLKTRKQIKAMAGDMDAEIRRLRKSHRPIAARWNICIAWGYAIYFVARSPVDKLATYLLHKIDF